MIEEFTRQQSKSAMSPENHFLSLQNLSPEEEVYINEQDCFRHKQYKDAMRRIAKKISEKPEDVLSSLNELKQQQKTSREENCEYMIKRAQNRP